MVSVRAKYKDGNLTLLDPAPVEEECEVLVIFPSTSRAERESEVELKPVPASEFHKLKGLVAWGGNALEDCERLYE